MGKGKGRNVGEKDVRIDIHDVEYGRWSEDTKKKLKEWNDFLKMEK